MINLFKTFLKLNRWKLILWFIPWVTWAGFIYYHTNGSTLTPNKHGLWILFIILIGVFTTFRRGIISFDIVDKLTKDLDSPKSIMSLFDDGYVLQVYNERTLYKYTSYCMKGAISGLPVIVSFSLETRSRWSYLDFSFTPLVRHGFKNNSEESIWFNMYRNEIKKDVKPEVLKFVNDLKEKGYAPAQQ